MYELLVSHNLMSQDLIVSHELLQYDSLARNVSFTF